MFFSSFLPIEVVNWVFPLSSLLFFQKLWELLSYLPDTGEWIPKQDKGGGEVQDTEQVTCR